MVAFLECATTERDSFIRGTVPVCNDAAVVGIVCQTDEVTSVTLTIVAECMGFFARNIAPFTAGNVMLFTIDDGGCSISVETLADLEIGSTKAVADTVFLLAAPQTIGDIGASVVAEGQRAIVVAVARAALFFRFRFV